MTSSFDTPDPIAVNVELVLGSLRVTAGDRADTVATVEPTNPASTADVTTSDATRVEYLDGRLTISTPKSWRRFSPFDNSGSVRVTLEVPTGSSLEASTSLGDIEVDGELDRCRLKTSMGNIRVDQVAQLDLTTGFGDVDVDRVDGAAGIHTGSGEVRVGRVAGAAVVKNSNGATSIGEVGGDVRVKAANGNISIASANQSIVARTAAGSIDVGEVRRGATVLETAAGNLSCGIAQGTAANLDVRCRYGRIRSALEATDGPASSDEVVELHAHTSVGDITLFRTDELAPRSN
jgi:DUF4097 and DUF4098 domain-containing protein YvlB